MHVDSKPIPVSNDTKSCRVCLETGAPGTLCQPCSCAGSMGHAHPSCIQRWIYERGEMTCEVCSDRYRGPFQPPPSVPPPRLTPPPLSQLGRSRGVFIAIDPVNEMYSWQANVAVRFLRPLDHAIHGIVDFFCIFYFHFPERGCRAVGSA
jgi:hypothetical protein